MAEKTTRINAIEMVRRIRDEQGRSFVGKSDAEIIDFYRKAGQASRRNMKKTRSAPPKS